jgi:predicted DNA-binding transcriptional regulator AlpA
MKMVLDVKGLAEALSISPVTVQQNASRHPERLPPRLKTPTRKLLWAVKDVEEWIERHRASPQVPADSGCSAPAET